MDIKTNATVLMVAGEHDSENSIVWSNSLYDQISNAVMITRRGDGSTAYYDIGEATKIIDDYLAYGTLPAPNTFVDS
jgi:TAP-like protein